MKISVLTALLCVGLVSCQNPSDTNEAANEPPAREATAEPTNLAKQEACAILSKAEVANLLAVEEAEIKQEDMSMGEKRSICYYYTAAGNRKLYLRLAWKSDKASANKVLQAQYEGYLKNGDNEISTYKQVQQSPDSQVLYGIGQDLEGKYIHLIRKRFANQAEVQIELTKETREENLELTLKEVLAEIK